MGFELFFYFFLPYYIDRNYLFIFIVLECFLNMKINLFCKLLSYFLLRMSLAMYAAPFNDEDNSNNKTKNNLPQKINNTESNKVLNVLQNIRNLPEADEENNYMNFQPLLPPPISSGVENSIEKEKEKHKENRYNSNDKNTNKSTNHSTNSSIEKYSTIYPDNNNLDHLKTVNPQYKRFIPDYETMYKNANHNYKNTRNNNDNDLLIEKLNYMIHLLEENQDERTSNVTEEVILYSFLGVFIIFIVDSFSSMKKYTR